MVVAGVRKIVCVWMGGNQVLSMFFPVWKLRSVNFIKHYIHLKSSVVTRKKHSLTVFLSFFFVLCHRFYSKYTYHNHPLKPDNYSAIRMMNNYYNMREFNLQNAKQLPYSIISYSFRNYLHFLNNRLIGRKKSKNNLLL